MKNSPEHLNAYSTILTAYEAYEDDVDDNIDVLIEGGFCRNVDEAAKTIQKAIVNFSNCHNFLPNVSVAVNAMIEDVVSKDLSHATHQNIEFKKGFLLSLTSESVEHIVDYLKDQYDYDQNYNVLNDTKILSISRNMITYNLKDVYGIENCPAM